MSPRGGAREGAGRKEGYRKPEGTKPHRPTISIVGSETELQRLKNKAKEAEKNTSLYVLESLNCLDEQNSND